MTGNSDTRSKFSAIFFAFIMVTSMVAIGGAAFAGSASAAVTSTTTAAVDDVEIGPETQTQDVTFDVTIDGSAPSETVTLDYSGVYSDSGDVIITGDGSDISIDSGDTGEVSVDAAGTNNDAGDTVTIGLSDDTQNGNAHTVTITATLTVDASGETSAAGNTYTVGGTTTDTFSITAAQSPSIQSVTRVPGTSSQVDVKFSEPVTDADTGTHAAIATSDFGYANNNGQSPDGFSAIDTTVGDNTEVRLTLNAPISSSDVGTDQINAKDGGTDGVKDLSGNAASTAQVTIQPSALQGPTINGEVETEIGGSGSQTIQAGVANNSLGQIQLRDVASGGGSFAGETTITLPEGVTVNSDSSLSTTTVITSNGDTGATIDGVSVSDDQQSIVLSHSGTSVNAETIRIASGALVVDVDGDEIDTTGTSTSLDIQVEYFSNSGSAALLSASHPDAVQNSQSNIQINADNEDAGNLRIDAGDYDADDFGNNTEIVLSVESGTGVTFDTGNIAADSTLVANTDLDTSSGDDELDPTAATITESEIRVPVVNEITQTDNNIRFENLAFATNGSATDADLNVTVESVSESSGPYQLNGAGDDTPTIDNFVVVDTPSISLANDDSIAVGATDQTVDEDLIVDLSNVALSSGSELKITTNNSAISFADPGLSGDGTDITSGAGTAGAGNIDTVDVTSDAITVTFSADPGANTIVFESGGELVLDADTSAADETPVSFDATFDSAVTVNSGDASVITLERPSTVLNNGNNVTVSVDNDGTQTTVDPDTSPATSNVLSDDTDPVSGAAVTENALVIQADDVTGEGVMIGADTSVLVTLESGTGVTFDQSADSPSNSLGENDDIDIDESSNVNTNDDLNDGSAPSVTENEITIPIDSGDNGLDSGEGLIIDELPLNVTGDAQNTTLSVTTTTGSGNDVTTVFEEQIIIEGAQSGSINADADTSSDTGTPQDNVGPDNDGANGGDFGNSDSAEAQTSLQVDNTVTSAVLVRDSNDADFGAANVDLEIVEQPDGASASLESSSVTTNSGGIAEFDFTAGSTTGDYVVNATVESADVSVNITYTAQPGNINGVSVTPIENAIASGGSDVGTASLYVNATDSNGNPVSKSATVSVTADNVGASGVTANVNKASDGTGAGTTDDLTDGEFSLDSDGSSVITVTSSQVENVTITAEVSGNSDTGTVTFFDQVGGVDLTLNESSVATGSTVSADATLTQEDGTVIEVPDVTVNYDDNSDGNTTFEGGADSDSATTDTSGVASVNVTAEQNGTSTIDATSNLRSASATLTIGGQADTGSPLDGTAGEYDSNGDGQVTATELGSASTAFAQGDLTASELGDVAVAFANS